MAKTQDLTGEMFGKWSVVKKTDKRCVHSGCIIYRCRCECGREREISSGALRSGKTNQCRDCQSVNLSRKGLLRHRKFINALAKQRGKREFLVQEDYDEFFK
jgi:hypothetical protein